MQENPLTVKNVSPIPNLWKWLDRLARWFFGIVLSLWIVFIALTLILQWLIVPRIGDFGPSIEKLAAQYWGLNVQLGSISVVSSGLTPTFEVNDFVLKDAANQEVLRFPQVVASVSASSIVQLEFEQLSVLQPELTVRRDKEGLIYVAGLPVKDQGPTQLADWFFSQPDFVVEKGLLRWVDEYQNRAPVEFQQVDFRIQSGLFQHLLRMDATPPPTWGERFSVSGKFRESFLSTHASDFKNWSGQIYAQSSRIDLSAIKDILRLPHNIKLEQGQGWARLWVDLQKLQWKAIQADIDFENVHAQVGEKAEPLILKQFKGRFRLRQLSAQEGIEFDTQAITANFQNGDVWPATPIKVTYRGATPEIPLRIQLGVQSLDLQQVQLWTKRFQLPQGANHFLNDSQPQGVINALQLTWQDAWLDKPMTFEAKGQASQISWMPVKLPGQDKNIPGLNGGFADFEFNQDGGKFVGGIKNGQLFLNDFWEDPNFRFQSVTAQVNWKILPQGFSMDVVKSNWVNEDLQADVQLKWATQKNAAEKNQTPSTDIDLQLQLHQAKANQISRYLPSALDVNLRNYLRDSIVQGDISKARLSLKGNLARLPIRQGLPGEFKISVPFKNAVYQYAPKKAGVALDQSWPALQQLSGLLQVDRQQLTITDAKGLLSSAPAIEWPTLQAKIADFQQMVVEVQAQGKGPLMDAVKTVNQSALSNLTQQALANTNATGNAEIQLRMNLPIKDLNKSKVQGAIVFNGTNDWNMGENIPNLSRVRGTVQFNEGGLIANGLRARAIGGDARIDGGLRFVDGPAVDGGTSVLRIQGAVTSQALRDASELGWISRFGNYLQGTANYTASVSMRRGKPEIQIISSLQGMSSSLPAPLNKTTESSVPFSVDTRWLSSSRRLGEAGATDSIQVNLGQVLSVAYQRDLSVSTPRVMRGLIHLGAPVATLQERDAGVRLLIDMNQADVKAWDQLFNDISGINAKRSANNKLLAENDSQYVPNQISIKLSQLSWGSRQMTQIAVTGVQQADVWKLNLRGADFSGTAEYKQASAASPGTKVFAKFSYLSIPPSAVTQMETALSDAPSSLPALDVVIEDLEFRGKKLGRLEMEANNRVQANGSNEWRLNKFNIITPEATFKANGVWSIVAGVNRTQLDFVMDIQNAGELLTRFGTVGAVRAGKGKMAGNVSWGGSPMNTNLTSMSGRFNVDVEKGQFLKTDPGVGRLLGILSLQSLPRRLLLDFRDVFSEGFAFDFFKGDVLIEQGIAQTNNLQMKGVSAAVLMEGHSDIEKETQDIKAVIIPEINAGTASLVYSAINPVIGLSTFLAQYFLRRPLTKANTQELHITGTWKDPKVEKVEMSETNKANPTEQVKP
ncbi:MAG: TIGR02099 family protein [Betaproteobacteria bacterium]|nr:TIGR02099 family protein [Betaproteobacteria bacterium]